MQRSVPRAMSGQAGANVIQAERDLQEAWDSCYARSQKNKS
jgi:hypothetical protein